MKLAPEAVTYNGTALEVVQIGCTSWSAGEITLTLRPNMTWRAARGDHGAVGSTSAAQSAVDALAAVERKAHRDAAARARLTKGQLFAREMRAYLHIGPRTRRHRESSDLHTTIVGTVIEAVTGQGMFNDRITEACRAAFGAALSYDKHIAGYRVDVKVSRYLHSLTPWDFCGLLGEMVDDDVIHVGAGERWFDNLCKALTYDTARDRVVRGTHAA